MAVPSSARSGWISRRSRHFIVEARDAAVADAVRLWAEQARQAIWDRWFRETSGTTAPPWPRPVRIVVHRHHPGFYATTFSPDGEVRITLWAGDRHLASTVRHEVWHAVVHLRYPGKWIPRWLDEGIAVCNESAAEQQRMIAPLKRTKRRYRLRELVHFKQYPAQVSLFYAQSYSLADYLVRRHGERNLIRFLEASFVLGQEPALKQVLGYSSLEDLERCWQSASKEQWTPVASERDRA